MWLRAGAGRGGPCSGVAAHVPRKKGSRQLCHDLAGPAAGHRGRGGSVSGAAPGGRSLCPGSTDGTSVSSARQRWNIGVVAVLAGPGLRGPAGRMGPAGRLAGPGARTRTLRRRDAPAIPAMTHPDPGDGGGGTRTPSGTRAPPEKTAAHPQQLSECHTHRSGEPHACDARNWRSCSGQRGDLAPDRSATRGTRF